MEEAPQGASSFLLFGNAGRETDIAFRGKHATIKAERNRKGVLVMIFIQNGHIKTMAGADLENGCILLDDNGKIAAVGAELTAPAGAQIIDAGGKLIVKGAMFAIPRVMIVVGYIIYRKKYKISEEFYAEILKDLGEREKAEI